MKKQPRSKLDPFAQSLQEWFTPRDQGGQGLSLAQARKRLLARGCSISLPRLSKWWAARQKRTAQQRLLAQVATGAGFCRDIEQQFGATAPPHLDTLIRLHRVIVLHLSAHANVDNSLISLVTDLMKPVMEWAKLEERQKSRLFAEQKHRDLTQARTASAKRQLDLTDPNGGIPMETLRRLEKHLKLM